MAEKLYNRYLLTFHNTYRTLVHSSEVLLGNSLKYCCFTNMIGIHYTLSTCMIVENAVQNEWNHRCEVLLIFTTLSPLLVRNVSCCTRSTDCSSVLFCDLVLWTLCTGGDFAISICSSGAFSWRMMEGLLIQYLLNLAVVILGLTYLVYCKALDIKKR